MRFLASVFVALVTLPETTTIDIQMHTEALMNSCLGSGDGNVSKEAFRAASLKLFPNLRPSEYETVWSRIGKDGEGCLQFPGLQCVPSSCCPAGAHRHPTTPRRRYPAAAPQHTDGQLRAALEAQTMLANKYCPEPLRHRGGSRRVAKGQVSVSDGKAPLIVKTPTGQQIDCTL